MFSRRYIQKLVGHVAGTMTPSKLESLVDRLNRTDRAALEATWELIWLASLAAEGVVRHEPILPGATRFPDIHFLNPELEFIADVATVSDAGYERDNPVELLQRELEKLYAKHAPGGGFSLCGLESERDGPYRNHKVKLVLPDLADIPRFVRASFTAFVQAVGAAPDQKAVHQASMPCGGVIQVDYNPARRPYIHGAGHLCFDVPYSLTRNPVANALKAKKRQLAEANFAGLKGVILCDGGCSMLSSTLYSATAYTVEQIVGDFLRQNSSVSFVLTVGVTTRHQRLGQPRWSYPLKLELYCQRALDAAHVQRLEKVVNSAASQIPSVHRTPTNALVHLTHGSPPPSRFSNHFGDWKFSEGNPMQKTEITISARTLTALLGGELEETEFRKLHCIETNNGSPSIELFQRVLNEGRQLVAVRLEPMPGEDDDSVVFSFGPTDPSKVKFKVPDQP